MVANTEYGISLLSAEQKAGMISTAVELAIGFWLLLGAKGIAALLFKVRTTGMNE